MKVNLGCNLTLLGRLTGPKGDLKMRRIPQEESSQVANQKSSASSMIAISSLRRKGAYLPPKNPIICITSIAQ
jgi:hypothetical protein